MLLISLLKRLLKPFKPNTVLCEVDNKTNQTTNSTSKTFELKSTVIVKLELVGAGGCDGGTYSGGMWYGSGGGGAAIVAVVALPQGVYRLTSGGCGSGGNLNSSPSSDGQPSKLERRLPDGNWEVLAVANGGKGVPWTNGNAGEGGTYSISLPIRKSILVSNGNKGNNGGYNAGRVNAAPAIYEGYGKGYDTGGYQYHDGTGGLARVTAI